jgi:hypothetical protein
VITVLVIVVAVIAVLKWRGGGSQPDDKAPMVEVPNAAYVEDDDGSYLDVVAGAPASPPTAAAPPNPDLTDSHSGLSGLTVEVEC